MRRPRPEPSLRQLGESVMGLVGEVAGKRLVMVSEFIHQDRIKPLEAENERLRSILRRHGIEH